ncbi:MAG TPA: metallophosphoesterase [Chitinophagaceae bacterium]|nr:metallophosphoesterase [Chitinophagaceae bacterium]
MKRYYLLILLLVFVHPFLEAQTDTLSRRIILIGDAGELTNGQHPVVRAVKKNIPLDNRTTILFLGDNLYKAGLPDEQYKTYSQARAVLDSQVSIADGTPAKVYMIPGNHDWENGGRTGYNAVVREQLYVDFLGNKNVKYYPEDGCPGPIEVPLGKDVVLILFDSQWWLHPHDKPEIESDCKCKTKDELVDQIEDIASRNSKKLVIIACHHPFKTNGVHGGFFTLKQHIFPLTDLRPNFYVPLPLIGSAYPIARSVFGAPQDISHPAYADMINRITTVVKRSSPNVIFVSGHDHNQQLIRDNGYNYIISGGGCKENRTSKNKNSLFNSILNGFAVMEISTNKNASVKFYSVTDTLAVSENFPLLDFSKVPAAVADSVEKITDDPFLKYKDTTSVPITKTLPLVTGLRKYFLGQNYRESWSQPVNMRVFNLRQEKGGFTVESLGGGKQTKSLRLINNKTKEEWVLRSMNKNPLQTIPETFRGSLAQDLVTELKSSSFPYSGFIVPGLAKPLRLATSEPELFFVPDDAALGFYRPLFANTVCVLEKRDASFDGSKTVTTAKMFDKILEENDHRPVQEDILEARLLDILVADYDRHFDQWRWGTIDTGRGKIYYPIGRDRDEAFFYSDGKLMRYFSGRILPFLKGLTPTVKRAKWLGYVSRDFDRIFLTDLDKQEWEKAATDIETRLTDSVISKAVKNLPPEIYQHEGENITHKLISRRNSLKNAALQYYNFLSKFVNVVGSNQKEHFKVSSVGDKLQVRVYAKAKGDTSFIMYDRIFDPAVTKEIRLFGLHDEDIFEVEENASSRIKIRVIGGRGIDTFRIKGHIETLLYDLKNESGADYFLADSSLAKKRFSADPPVNERSLLGFNYNSNSYPNLHLNYNSDDGRLGGVAVSRRTYGFRNLPYATDQRLSAVYSFDHRAVRLHYKGEFNQVLYGMDLVTNIDHASQALRNFYGFGNNSYRDPAAPKRYYQTFYRYTEAEILVRKRYFDKFHLVAGPYFYSYDANYKRNSSNVLGKPSQIRLDSSDIFSKKAYAGVKVGAILDNRNKEFTPTRGIYWRNELLALAGLKEGSHKYMSFVSDMSIYASFRESAKFMAILRAGGGKIFNRNYEYFQAMTIGAENDLPGFRKNRYAGRASMYGGLEFRFQLFNINSYIIPGQFGFATFYNIGKVWHPNDITHKWHGAYGVGVYFLPYHLFAISAYAGFSGKEKMLNFSLGTKINLTY